MVAAGLDAGAVTGLISHIEIRRFKGIDSISLDIDDKPTVFVGTNNSGKSSVLHAIHFAVSIAQSARLVGEGVSWRLDKYELSFNPTQLIWSPIANVMSLAKGGYLEEAAPRRIEISLSDMAGNQSTISVRRGRNRNIQVAIEGRTLGERLQDIERPFSIFTPGLAGISREEQFLSPGLVRRAVARGDANLVLRNVLLMLHRNRDKWNTFLTDMRVVFPGIDFQVSFNDDTDETISTTVIVEGSPELPLDAAGTGVLQAAQILGYSALYEPPLILLDEPDSHLHPNNQRALCQLLTELATQRRFRLLISSHSRHVLDALRGSSHIVWMTNGASTAVENEGLTARLLDLGALDTVDYFADTETKSVVVTEDTETNKLTSLLESNGFVIDDTRIGSYSGCTQIQAATVLGQFIESHTNNVTVVVHRDRDYMTVAEADEYSQKIRNCGLQAFITDGPDVEWYFLNAAHLHELNPEIDEGTLEQFITEAIAESRTESLKKMINMLTERAFRRRSETGRAPDHGEIATNAAAEYDRDPKKHCHGKTVIGRVAARIQKALGRNPRLYDPSSHLVDANLTRIAREIWAPANGDNGR